ncbi:putative metalloprotease CJM1_0395 family protein [Marinobacteraceae bacterium S3BR75-40.1]
MQANSVPAFNPFLTRPALPTTGRVSAAQVPQSLSRTFPSVAEVESDSAARPAATQSQNIVPGTRNPAEGGAPQAQSRSDTASEDGVGSQAGSAGAEDQSASPVQRQPADDQGAGDVNLRPRGADGEPLSPEEVQLLDKLQARDQQVRQHERAHQSVGGQYAGSASYSYKQGPDGQRYAMGGEVPIDMSPVPGDPKATIEKMRTVKAAAMAPAEPSAADRQIAARATQVMISAQVEMALQQQGGTSDKDDSDTQGKAPSGSGSGSVFGRGEAAQTYARIDASGNPDPTALRETA